MASLEFTWPARRDLEDILSYIAPDSPMHARRFVERIVERCTILARYPLSGRLRSEFAHIDAGMRSWSAKPVVIFYRYLADARRVEVLRVVDGRRDLHTVFTEEM